MFKKLRVEQIVYIKLQAEVPKFISIKVHLDGPLKKANKLLAGSGHGWTSKCIWSPQVLGLPIGHRTVVKQHARRA